VEWPTVLVGLGCHAGILAATARDDVLGYGVAALLLTLALNRFSSLSHEVLHGHPFRTRAWNEALVFPALGLFIPYGRFRETHLAHHHDPVLTDPYDDPESHFVDPAV
jgi:fatty acid desaturase